MSRAYLRNCIKCNGTGRRRDMARLAYLLIAMLLAVALVRLGSFARDGHEEMLIKGFTAPIVMICLYVLVVNLWGFARAKCLACAGHGGDAALPRATPFLSVEDRRRLAGNRCLRCGYDLTGNLSGTCPECGGDINSDWLHPSTEAHSRE